MENKIKENNYITVQAFMRNELNLKSNELLVYAIIYGFSQDGECKFTGTAGYISEWTGINKRSVYSILKKLEELGYINKHKKIINGVTLCDYSVCSSVMKNFHRGDEKISQGVMKNFHRGDEKTSHHIIEDNIKDNIEDIIDKERNIKERNIFKKPTVEEIKSYCIERNNYIDAENFYDYYESNGWKVGKNQMKDWKATVRTWERNNYGKPIKKKKSTGLF